MAIFGCIIGTIAGAAIIPAKATLAKSERNLRLSSDFLSIIFGLLEDELNRMAIYLFKKISGAGNLNILG